MTSTRRDGRGTGLAIERNKQEIPPVDLDISKLLPKLGRIKIIDSSAQSSISHDFMTESSRRDSALEKGVNISSSSRLDGLNRSANSSFSTDSGASLGEPCFSQSEASCSSLSDTTDPFEGTNSDVLLGQKEPVIICEPLPFDEVCVNFNRGYCKYNDSCRRLHVLVDDQKVRDTQAKVFCKALSHGCCDRGDLCPWLHPSVTKNSSKLEISSKAAHDRESSSPSDSRSSPPIVSLTRVESQRPMRALKSSQCSKRSRRRKPQPQIESLVTEDSRIIIPLASDNSTPPTDDNSRPVVKIAITEHPLPKHPDLGVPSVTATTPKAPVTPSRSDVIGLPPEYCRKWSRGLCLKGTKCKFKHAERSPNNAVGPGNLAATASQKSAPAPPPSASQDTHTKRSTPDSLALGRVQEKADCTFCLLGLCTNEHYTVSSLRVPNIPVTSASAESVNTAKFMHLNAGQRVECVQNARPVLPESSTSNTTVKRPSESEEITVTLLKSTRVTLGSGFRILDVITSFESSYVLLGHLPAVISEADVRNIAVPFGDVLKVECRNPHSSASSSTAKLQFATSAQAAAAVAALNGADYFFDKLTAVLDCFQGAREVGRLSACAVRVDVPAPGVSAYAGYETLLEAERVVKAVHGYTVKSHVVAARLHFGRPKTGQFTVKFEGLPHQTTEKGVRALGGGGRSGKTNKSGKANADESDASMGNVLLGRVAYKSLGDVTNVLKDILGEHGTVISLDFHAALPINGRVRGVARFADPAGAAAACANLNARRFAFLGSERIYLDHMHRLNYKTTPEVYKALVEELERLTNFARNQPGVQMTISHSPTGSGEMEIQLSGSHLDSLKRVKVPLEHMLAGEKLVVQSQGHTQPVWDKFFSTESGNTFIKRVEQSTHTHIFAQYVRCFVTLWGSPAARGRARECILEEVCRLRARKCYALPLSGRLLFQILFSSLDAIQVELGKDNVFVDFVKRRLVVRGTEEQFRWVVTSLSKNSIFPHHHTQANTKNAVSSGENNSCPICLDIVVDGISLRCGHKTCKQCLVRYLSSANDHRSFPLKCLGDDNRCPEELPLPLCKKLLQKEQFARLIDASFFAYIHARPHEFRFCPSPDCPQIYRTAAASRIDDESGSSLQLQCPSCLTRICTACHGAAHDGEVCSGASTKSRAMSERLFREWKDAHNVKACPKCSASIEKIAGCNHMLCASCSTHICWACMETFQGSTEVYEHMRKAHGGIGL